MAKQPETIKYAAVWNPPRITQLNLGAVRSGTKGQNPYSTDTWEGHCPPTNPLTPGAAYRMPTSGEVGTFSPAC